ncbi:26S proteasome non-ATPase regulatory subunit 5 [Cinnamomum micranthum f. kanehirae]|uniref:26S proteasome non-ATPase regulatory subunit 5 n=1 Tax=Cinnamomum micranthum f. kanehirae TaxID=337451 RepID=A0A3S3PET5_9MAGN|nr:26S proteasome non-ATPase regulatory subunit 5 [Cinnamomum micranthum f. kanehirae]
MDDSNPAQNLPIPDASLLAQAATEFASYPGIQTDASAKEFLDRFPLAVIFSALQCGADVPGLENALVSCLERIFGTKYGSSFIPHYMPFVQAGLQAYSQMVRCLACKAVSYLLVNVDGNTGAAVELVIKYDIYPLLLNCLIEGNELVAAASTDAIVNIARSPGGIDIVFPTNSDEATHLMHIAARCSSLARIRVLALIVKLFSISSLVASAVYDSKLLGLLEAEVNNKSDMLTTLSALELLYELAESPHGIKFVLKTTLLQLLTSIISNASLEPILRSRAILISGRLLSSDDTFRVVDESSKNYSVEPEGVRTTLLAIDARLELLKDQHADECESAFDALGQIGASIQGAALLLSTPSPVARHVVEVAFDRKGSGKQLAALHALANISGENRSEDSIMLNDGAEECLRSLVYATAASSSKLTPSGLFLSLLQQGSEIRLAAYRVIAGLVTRQWCLLEICSKQDIINIVTDAHMETAKKGMEARFKCCTAINKSLSASSIQNDGAIAEISTKLQEAVRRGPYLGKERSEAQPAVMTAESSIVIELQGTEPQEQQARIRVLALIVKLFSISSLVASAVYDSKLLGLLEAEVNNKSDMLTTLSALELLYELAESPHGIKFVLKTTLLQLLTSIISNASLEPILRSRAILISGRLLSSDDTFRVVDESSKNYSVEPEGVRTTLLAIDARLELLKDQHADECESAFDALGQIGASIQGAALLLSTPSPVARHVVEVAFDRKGSGKQLAALHALANISGENRSEDGIMLNDGAEECLRSLVYATAARSSKLTPSGLFLSLLQQGSEIRLAAYRVIAGLVTRQWCLLEICSKQDIINIVTDAHMETAKKGMEARFKCCTAINKSLSASSIRNDGAIAEISTKLQEAIRRGPYLGKERSEAQPAVMTAERF